MFCVDTGLAPRANGDPKLGKSNSENGPIFGSSPKISVSDQGRSPTNLLKIFGRLRRPIFLGPNTQKLQKLRSIRTSGRSWKSSLITRIQCWSLFKIEVLTESLFIIFSHGFSYVYYLSVVSLVRVGSSFQNPGGLCESLQTVNKF